VRLPCRVQTRQAVAATPPADPPLKPPVASLRIVIVDDNRDAADSLAMLLTMDGHQVSVTHDGVSALSVIEAVRPQVAVLDIGMPDMNGYQLAQRIRSSLPSEPMVLVALTGWGQAQDLARAKAAGFDHHLVKPAEPEAIRSLIASIGGRA
jgi:CheY-like chemotaxis protein